MNNLIDRVNRLFSWKNQQYQQQETTTYNNNNNSSSSWSNELQLETNPNLDVTTTTTNSSWPSPTPPSLSNQDYFLNMDSNNNSTSHLLSELRPSSSNYSTTNNDDSTNNTQPLLDPIETVTENTQNQHPNVIFSQPNINTNRQIQLTTNISNSNRRHHRSSRSHRSNVNAPTSTIRSFFQNRRSSLTLNSAAPPPPPTSANHHTSGAYNSLSYLFNNIKKRERNFLSACCSVFSIAILSVSLVETRWFYLNGGGCNVNYVGVAHFFAPGRLEYQREMSRITNSEIIMFNFVLPNGLVLKNCANREIIFIMRTIIAFVFMAIFCSCIGLMLDTFGCMKKGIRLIRRHAVFHILTVIFCLAINGFCFWISERMNEQQIETRTKKGKQITVSFDVSYYLIVLSSGLSIMATAFTLIRRYSTDEDDQLERLLEEYTGFEDPIHLERSLPANPAATTPQQNENNFLNFMSANEQASSQSSSTQRPQIYNSNGIISQYQNQPAPPSTPPPSLHHFNYATSSLCQDRSEPPPPYDPTPVIT